MRVERDPERSQEFHKYEKFGGQVLVLGVWAMFPGCLDFRPPEIDCDTI